MPDTEIELATHAAERLRKSIADLEVSLGSAGDSVQVTVSVGVATSTGEVSKATQLIDQADAALYEAKKEGRDRVVTASGMRVSVMPDRQARASQ